MKVMPAWIIIFIAVALVIIVVYIITVRKKTDRDEFMEKPDPGEENEHVTRGHSPLR
jgi:hypothetical protein